MLQYQLQSLKITYYTPKIIILESLWCHFNDKLINLQCCNINYNRKKLQYRLQIITEVSLQWQTSYHAAILITTVKHCIPQAPFHHWTITVVTNALIYNAEILITMVKNYIIVSRLLPKYHCIGNLINLLYCNTN